MQKIRQSVMACAFAAVVLSPGSVWAETPVISTWCKALRTNPNDGPAALDMTSGWVASYMLQEQYFLLAQMVQAWNIPTCLWDDGRPRLIALVEGYKLTFRRERDWSVSANRINNLKKAYPKSGFAALAEAQYWIDYAWNARGTGYSSSVTTEGWKLFRERLEKAEQVLIESESYASEIPSWYEEMIKVKKSLDRPADQIAQIFLEGTAKFKTYLPIYFVMANFMLPKWGGSWEMFDNLVTGSVDNTKATEGSSMYARLYWLAGNNLTEGENLFKNTEVSWPKMRSGFEDLMQRHPKSLWNLNNFAAFACRADDKKTFLTLRNKIGTQTIDQAWPQNYSLDLCDHKYGYVK